MRSQNQSFAVAVLLSSVVISVSCKSGGQSLDGMHESERRFNQRQGEELVTQMSLEAMFEDPQVRELAESAGAGEVRRIESLIARGVDVNSRGKHGATLLFWALRNSSFRGYKRLLESGADPNILFSGSSVMHWAARHKDVRFLSAALDHGGDPNLVAGNLSETPIFRTIGIAGSENIPAMRLLVENGANINATTTGKALGMSFGGKTPLLVAADLGRFDLAYELLELGADHRIEDDSGWGLLKSVKSFHGRFPAGSDAANALDKVINWLSDKGIDVLGGS